MQFRGIAVSDAGRYTCSARNSVGTAEAVAEVIVNGKRTVLHSSHKQNKRNVNQS